VKRPLHQRNGKELKKTHPRIIADNEINSYRMAVDIERRKAIELVTEKYMYTVRNSGQSVREVSKQIRLSL
jgi:methylthioribose-1-phosphate isomerase